MVNGYEFDMQGLPKTPSVARLLEQSSPACPTLARAEGFLTELLTSPAGATSLPDFEAVKTAFAFAPRLNEATTKLANTVLEQYLNETTPNAYPCLEAIELALKSFITDEHPLRQLAIRGLEKNLNATTPNGLPNLEAINLTLANFIMPSDPLLQLAFRGLEANLNAIMPNGLPNLNAVKLTLTYCVMPDDPLNKSALIALESLLDEYDANCLPRLDVATYAAAEIHGTRKLKNRGENALARLFIEESRNLYHHPQTTVTESILKVFPSTHPMHQAARSRLLTLMPRIAELSEKSQTPIHQYVPVL